MTSVVLAADERYLPYAICTLEQLAQFGRGADGVTLIVPSTAQEAASAGLAEAAGCYGINLDIRRLADLAPLRASGLLSDSGYISHFTYAKLLLAESLPHLDHVLYLDIDTLIRAPLDALLSWELRHPLGAVEELGLNSRRIFGTSRAPYFNAGVLRMSLERMRQEGVWQRAQEVLRARPGLRFQDQDILNLLLQARIDILPSTYNVFDSLYLEHRELWTMRDPAIVHFAGPVKPWHRAAQSRFALEWRRHYSEARNSTGIGRPDHPGNTKVTTAERRDGITGLARRALPDPVKKAARFIALSALDRTAARVDETRTRLELGSGWRSHLEITDPSIEDALVSGDGGCSTTEDPKVDLLISLPHCGANLLADSIGSAIPGLSHRQGLTDQPAAGPDKRTLVTEIPHRLNHRALAEFLSQVRPRVLILRREMVFSLSATPSDAERISESAAADYVLRCDEWFDHALRLAGKLNLPVLSVTFSGLFGDGREVSRLAAFYPGASFALDPESGALRPATPLEADRSDTSILHLIRSMSSLSTATRDNLLRLPGTCFTEETPKQI